MKKECALLLFSLLAVFFSQIFLRLDPYFTNGSFSLFTLISFIVLACRGLGFVGDAQRVGVLFLLQIADFFILIYSPNLKVLGSIALVSSPVTATFFIMIAGYLFMQKFTENDDLRRFFLIMTSSIPLFALIGIIFKITFLAGNIPGLPAGIGTSLYTLLFGCYFLFGFVKYEYDSFKHNYQTYLNTKIFLFISLFFVFSTPLHILGFLVSEFHQPLSVSILHVFSFIFLAAGIYVIIQRHNADKLIRYCAWSKKVEYKGEWIQADAFLERMGFKVTHGIAPEEKETLLKKYFNDNKEDQQEDS